MKLDPLIAFVPVEVDLGSSDGIFDQLDERNAISTFHCQPAPKAETFATPLHRGPAMQTNCRRQSPAETLVKYPNVQ